VKSGNYQNFQSPFEEIFGDCESSTLISSFCGEIVAHLEILSTSFDRYFTEGEWKLRKKWLWIHTSSIWVKCQIKENRAR